MQYIIKDFDQETLDKAAEKRLRKNKKRLEVREKEKNAKIHISESKKQKGV
jgi:two-component SAPR family response regulator